MPNLEDYSLITQHLIMTEHLNPNHVIFGGQLLAWLDVDVYLHISKLVKYKNWLQSPWQMSFLEHLDI